MPTDPIIKPGDRFWELTVIEFDGSRNQRRYWKCLCDCGNTVIMTTGELHTGRPKKTCGLCKREWHGRCRTPEYNIWILIKRRCYKPGSPYYEIYGGRGIRMCDGWRNSFIAFFRDMGPRPSSKHSIERLNNSEGYNCGHCDDCISRGVTANCVWALMRQQAQNTRRNRNIVFNGETLCMSEWARRLGMSANILRARLFKLGWSPEKALSTPVKHSMGPQKPKAPAPPQRET